jgi:hypothetical protein
VRVEAVEADFEATVDCHGYFTELDSQHEYDFYGL